MQIDSIVFSGFVVGRAPDKRASLPCHSIETMSSLVKPGTRFLLDRSSVELDDNIAIIWYSAQLAWVIASRFSFAAMAACSAFSKACIGLPRKEYLIFPFGVTRYKMTASIVGFMFLVESFFFVFYFGKSVSCLIGTKITKRMPCVF